MSTTQSGASAKWLAPGSGEHYARERFQSSRARARDAACVRALLDSAGAGLRFERALDVPCGSGRLLPELAARAEHCAGVDISRAMLAAAAPVAAQARASLFEADGAALPFASHSFDLVVACRWLHHLHEAAALQAALGELVRVSRGLVIASFWDERSLPGLRRKLGLKRGEGAHGRAATSRDAIEGCLAEAGADVVGWRATLRFVAQQTFVAARVRQGR